MGSIGRVSLGALGVLLLAGCFDFGDGGDGCTMTNGLAGNGLFTYECTSRADPFCDGASESLPHLPTSIARGARFRIRFNGGAFVRPVSSKAVAAREGDFVALVSGSLGFVALAGSGPDAFDAVRLISVEADGLAIDGAPDTATDEATSFSRWSGANAFTSPRLLVGQQASLRAIATRREPLSGATSDVVRPLSGAISDVVWTIEPPEIATLEPLSDALVHVSAVRAGKAIVVATRGAMSAVAHVEIDDRAPVLDAGVLDAEPDGGNERDASDAGGDS